MMRPGLCSAEHMEHRIPAPKCAQFISSEPSTEQDLYQHCRACFPLEMGPCMISWWLFNNQAAQIGCKKPHGIQWVVKAGEGWVCSALCCLVTAGDGGVEAGGVGLG